MLLKKQKENSKKLKETYFQTQSSFSLQCGLCAVNNLLGSKQFSKDDFEQICDQLSQQFPNNYKHFFGGDYDVSVLIKALNQKKMEIQWHDIRKQLKNFQSQQGNELEGFLLNIKMPQSFYHRILRFSGRHWICIKIMKQQGVSKVILLDSLQQKPKKLSFSELQEYLKKCIKQQAQILKIYNKNNDLTSKSSKQQLQTKQQQKTIVIKQQNIGIIQQSKKISLSQQMNERNRRLENVKQSPSQNSNSDKKQKKLQKIQNNKKQNHLTITDIQDKRLKSISQQNQNREFKMEQDNKFLTLPQQNNKQKNRKNSETIFDKNKELYKNSQNFQQTKLKSAR